MEGRRFASAVPACKQLSEEFTARRLALNWKEDFCASLTQAAYDDSGDHHANVPDLVYYYNDNPQVGLTL